MAGILPVIRMKHSRRLRHVARFPSAIDDCWGRPKRREIAEKLRDQSTSLEERWQRAARFGPWLFLPVTPIWLYSLAAIQAYEEVPDAKSSVVALVCSVIFLVGNMVLVSILIFRYDRGDERPFVLGIGGSEGTSLQLGKSGKRALAIGVALGFVAFMVWANRPLP